MGTFDWKKYMVDHDEGLGTVYERFVLEELLEKFLSKYRFSNVVEVPLFGMTGVSGINSAYFAKRGCEVTLVDNNRERLEMVKSVWNDLGLSGKFIYVKNPEKLPFEDNSFGLVWNFAALWHVRNASLLLNEMARISSSLVFVCVPNKVQVGYMLRKLFEREFFKNVEEKWINLNWIEQNLKGAGIRIAARGILDIPPWPDTCFSVTDFLPTKKKGWRWSMMDHYRGSEELKDRVMRYSFIEKSRLPEPLKKLWAHHNYLLGEKVV